MGVSTKGAGVVMRIPVCDGNKGWSVQDSGTAAGGCHGEEGWKTSLVKTEMEKEKVSHLVLSEYMVHVRKAREARLCRRAKASYGQPSAAS